MNSRKSLVRFASLLLFLFSALGCLSASAEQDKLSLEDLNPADVNEIPLEAALAANPLPIDFSGGFAPREKFYLDGYTYKDPTISVAITFRENLADYVPAKTKKSRAGGAWIVDIQIGDVSQLRTAAAESFDLDSVDTVQNIAERVNAVIAFNGDFATRLKNEGLIIRQGVTFKDKLKKGRDVLAIDEDGDFHVYVKPGKGEVGDTIDGKKVINAFYFGPVLVNNGEVQEKFTTFQYLHEDDYFARIAFCQVGRLHYKMIVTTMQDVTVGLRLKELAQLCRDEGAQYAFNLDGGYSATLFFRGEQLNSTKGTEPRQVPDIIYFASAWNGEAAE